MRVQCVLMCAVRVVCMFIRVCYQLRLCVYTTSGYRVCAHSCVVICSLCVNAASFVYKGSVLFH